MQCLRIRIHETFTLLVQKVVREIVRIVEAIGQGNRRFETHIQVDQAHAKNSNVTVQRRRQASAGTEG